MDGQMDEVISLHLSTCSSSNVLLSQILCWCSGEKKCSWWDTDFECPGPDEKEEWERSAGMLLGCYWPLKHLKNKHEPTQIWGSSSAMRTSPFRNRLLRDVLFRQKIHSSSVSCLVCRSARVCFIVLPANSQTRDAAWYLTITLECSRVPLWVNSVPVWPIMLCIAYVPLEFIKCVEKQVFPLCCWNNVITDKNKPVTHTSWIGNALLTTRSWIWF